MTRINFHFITAAAGRQLKAWRSTGQERTETPPGLYGQLSLFTFCVFCLNVLALLYFYVVTGYGQLREAGENAPVEPLTAALFGGAGLTLFLAAVAAGSRRLRWLYILAGLAALFVAGEEANWGQRIFGFATPGFLATANYQGDANLHNTYLLGDAFGALSYIAPTLLYVATIAAFILRKYRLGALPLPSLWLAFFLALATNFDQALSLPEIIALDGRHLLLILGVFLGASLLARDKRLLTVVVAVITLSGAAFYLHGQFYQYSQVAYGEIAEYLLGLAAFLYSLQLLRDCGGEHWHNYGRRIKERIDRVGGRPAVANFRQPGRSWEYHSWRWAWPAACLSVALASIALVFFDRQLTAGLEREYRELTAGPPAIQTRLWRIYHTPGQLAYVKNATCPRISDKESSFFLHIVPIHHDDLPPAVRETGFQNLNFNYSHEVERFLSADGKCMVAIPLPDYPMAQISTGQYDFRWEQLWIARLDLDADYYRAAYQPIAAGQAGPPLSRSSFDLYRYNNALYYLKESCAPADTAARFFLHLIPEKPEDLPAARRAYGFANRDFDFNRRGHWFDGKCLAIVPLPDYPIAEIRTGQFTAADPLWESVLPAGN